MRPVELRELQSRPTDLVEAEWKPVRALLGISGFGANGYVARQPGEIVIEDHSEAESGYEELYVVTAGEVTFTAEPNNGSEKSFPMRAGQFIFVPPDHRRFAVAQTAGASVLVLGGVPGRPFTVSAWEHKRL